MTKLRLNKKGFGLIELLVVGAIIAISFVGFMTFILFSRDQTLKAQRKTEAVGYAEEAIEVVRKLRDDGYTGNIASKTAGTTYYPTISGNAWSLSTSNPGATNGYTTTVVFSSVNRDGSANIATSGTADPDSKKVVATVSYNDSGNKTVQLTTYITNINGN